MSSSELRNLEAFGMHVYREAGRDLSRPGDVASTVEAVTIDVGKFQAMSLTAAHYVGLLLKCAVPDTQRLESLQTLFVKARDAAGVYYATSVTERQCVIDDSGLTVERDIVKAYDALLELAASLHNSLNALGWIIGEQIAESDSILPGSFESAEDLFSALGV